MIAYVDMYKFIPSRSRAEYQKQSHDKNVCDCSAKIAKKVKKFISKKLIRMQKKTLSKMSKNFSNNSIPHFDFGLICSNLSNVIAKKKIEIPNICHIFKLQIPYSLFFDSMYNQEEIENFFFESGKKTDRFIFFEKSYIQARIGIDLSGKSIYNKDFSPKDTLSKVKQIQHKVANHLSFLAGQSSPTKRSRRKASSLDNHVYNE